MIIKTSANKQGTSSRICSTTRKRIVHVDVIWQANTYRRINGGNSNVNRSAEIPRTSIVNGYSSSVSVFIRDSSDCCLCFYSVTYVNDEATAHDTGPVGAGVGQPDDFYVL